VDLRAYDAAGREVSRIASGEFPAGTHAISWIGCDDEGRALHAGAYFCRLRVDGDTPFEKTVRATLLH
jgi:flagellar hook assembly protein FlgD